MLDAIYWSSNWSYLSQPNSCHRIFIYFLYKIYKKAHSDRHPDSFFLGGRYLYVRFGVVCDVFQFETKYMVTWLIIQTFLGLVRIGTVPEGLQGVCILFGPCSPQAMLGFWGCWFLKGQGWETTSRVMFGQPFDSKKVKWGSSQGPESRGFETFWKVEHAWMLVCLQKTSNKKIVRYKN